MKVDDCKMITNESLDPRAQDVERNPKPASELKIREVKWFGDSYPRTVRVKKNFPDDFKGKLVKLLKKYHECFA